MQLAAAGRGHQPGAAVTSALRPVTVVRGAAAVAKGAASYQRPGLVVVPAVVNGAAGAVSFEHGQPVSVMAVTTSGGKITALDILNDPERLARLDLAALRNR